MDERDDVELIITLTPEFKKKLESALRSNPNLNVVDFIQKCTSRTDVHEVLEEEDSVGVT